MWFSSDAMSLYLDNAATSHPKPQAVYDRVRQALEEVGASPGRGAYRRAREASGILTDARKNLATLFDIPDPEQIVFTANATDSINVVLKGWLRPGERVVISSLQHNAVVRPLARLAQTGVMVETVPSSSGGRLDLDHFRRLLTPPPRLVVLVHACNVNGALQPVEEIARLCRSAGVPLLLDAAQTAGIQEIRVNEWDLGMLACSGHKGLLGPSGVGVLYIRPDLDVAPLREGADFVMGSRIKGNIHAGAMPFLNRYLGTPVLTFLINLFFKTAISDVNCGMRALTKKAFTLLNLKSGGMEFASEMVIKAALTGLKTVEVTTSLFPDNRDRAPHLRPFRDGWRHLRFICLFAPTWLFLIPGMISLLTGSVIMTCILLLNLKNFGFFTMFFAQGLIYLGAQVIFLGISARGFAHFKAFLIRNDPVDRFMRSFTLEKGIALGTILSITGVGTCGWVGYKILEFMAKPENAGIFNANLTKIGIVGSTIAILGLQMIFSSFYSGLFNVEVADDVVSDEAPLLQ